jgi:hypothetical protein
MLVILSSTCLEALLLLKTKTSSLRDGSRGGELDKLLGSKTKTEGKHTRESSRERKSEYSQLSMICSDEVVGSKGKAERKPQEKSKNPEESNVIGACNAYHVTTSCNSHGNGSDYKERFIGIL